MSVIYFIYILFPFNIHLKVFSKECYASKIPRKIPVIF